MRIVSPRTGRFQRRRGVGQQADGTYDACNIAHSYGTYKARYEYAFDTAGNRLSQTRTIGTGSPTTTTWAYNLLNQITNSGSTDDARGNLTHDGANSYTWDRANRLLSVAGVTTAYDGLGNRITRAAGGVTTHYMLDLQPGLTQILANSNGANVTRYVGAAGDVLAHEDSAGNWAWFLPDGLGSVRGVTDGAGAVLEHRHYDPFGNLASGAMSQTDYGFTGEPFDATSAGVGIQADYVIECSHIVEEPAHEPGFDRNFISTLYATDKVKSGDVLWNKTT